MAEDRRALLELYVRYAVKSIGPSDLHRQIVQLLVLDSDETMFDIAACGENDAECIVKRADALFESRGFSLLDWLDVLRVYATAISRDILSGAVSEEHGANLIANTVLLRALPETFHDLDTFRYAASELPDRRSEVEMFRRGIKEAARQLVSSLEAPAQKSVDANY